MPVIIIDMYSGTPGAKTVDFGTKLLGQSDDTTDGVPAPFIIENTGTVVASVINSTSNISLWVRAPSPSDKFQLMVNDSEPGSINLTGSATSWTNVSLANVTVISALNYSKTHDTARVDVKITVPDDEPAGSKSVDITFYSTQT